MDQDAIKKLVGEYAINYVKDGVILGVGTGSTIKYFIDALQSVKSRIEGAVASSEETKRLLKEHNIPILDLNSAGPLDIYIDGADEIDHNLHLIKGGGAALTREKIIAAASKKFICIADESKYVKVLGGFPLPVEVIPMARSHVARELVKWCGGTPVWREGVTTDNGNWIIDVHNLQILNPAELEHQINNITGVVTNGLFAVRKADEVVLGDANGKIQILN